MPRYRVKTIEVEAQQVHIGNAMDLARWCGTQGQMIINGPPVPILGSDGNYLLVSAGDWIIKGPDGKFGFMDDEAFKESFDLIEEN